MKYYKELAKQILSKIDDRVLESFGQRLFLTLYDLDTDQEYYGAGPKGSKYDYDIDWKRYEFTPGLIHGVYDDLVEIVAEVLREQDKEASDLSKLSSAELEALLKNK